MPANHDAGSPPPFVAVGGLGGSGTRLIATLLTEFGIFLGRDLNKELDNLAFTLLFKRRELLASTDAEIDSDLRLFATMMTRPCTLTAAGQAHLRQRASEQRSEHPDGWLQARADALIEAPHVPLPPGQLWGWKEPNSHILLPALIRNFPDMRYIHVVRHGLDMAFSRNLTQLQYWGDAMLGGPGETGPARALSYWCAAQKRARRLGEMMGDRFLWLDYDHLCLDPHDGLDRLGNFLGLPCPDREKMLAMIRPPASMGRFRRADCSMLSSADIKLVAEYGFVVD
ncbi:MAG TPA: sulfotransferase [Luteimonas sp.]|nr:sulfotransferase [Luteimonas sp.]